MPINSQFCEILFGDSEFGTIAKRSASIAFLSLASIFSFFEYSAGFWGFWTTSMRPGLISAVISIVIVCPLYMRGILVWRFNCYGILSFALITLVLSSMVQLASGGGEYSSSVTLALIGVAAVLSWFGLEGVAGFCWILIVLSAIIYVFKNNVNMGFCGYLYVVSAFLGLVMHSGLNPGNFLRSLKKAYGNEQFEKIKSDVRKNLS